MAVPIGAIASIISALSSLAGGVLNKRGSTETPIQEQQRGTIDDLLASLSGDGPYSDLFTMNEETFNKSYLEPAKARFRNQIVPQIQQSYISSGQQRGTGLEDQLARAGVDLDQMLNQQYAGFEENALNRKMQALQGILGQGAGAAPEQSFKSALGQAAGGYLSSGSFQQSLQQLLNSLQKPGLITQQSDQRTGFSS